MGGEVSEQQRPDVISSHEPHGLLDDPELSAIAGFAAKLCEAPTALVSLVEEDRQLFLAKMGLDARETPRSESFCQHAMVLDHVMEVPDATIDERFANNRLVTGDPHIRFYAGAPLISDEGVPLGALCVISPEPRTGGLTSFQREGLSVLASAVMRRLKDRRARIQVEAALAESRDRFDALADAIPQMAWSTKPDGQTDYFNARWYEFTGVERGQHDGAQWIEALHPDDRDRAAKVWQAAVDSGEPYEVEYRLLRADGEYRWTLARGLPMKGANGEVLRWFGTNTDIHESRLLVEREALLSRELNHRIKNIFSLVGGLVNVSAREHAELAPLATRISERIAALGKAHHYVRPESEGKNDAVSFRQLLDDLLEPYRDRAGSRLSIEGEDLPLSAVSVTPMALVFHELATNAVKYGALSQDDGRVTVKVHRDGDQIHMDWIEHGGPTVNGTALGSGFGSQLVDMSIRRQLGGSYKLYWNERGLRVAIVVPAGRI